MPHAKNQRGKLLCLERFLRDRSDAEHPVTMDQILAHLAGNGIEAERKSVYEDLAYLRAQGLEIGTARLGRVTGYYLAKRDFTLPELKLLVDAVQSSKFITERKSLDLIGRIEKLGSCYQAKQLRRQLWVRGRVRTMNDSVFRSVDRINAALEADRQIFFQYFTWNARRERVLRRDGARYAVSPWALLLDNENYYLLAFEGGVMKHFRVDKMLSIVVSDRPREGRERFEALNMAAYTDTHFGMFSGESTRVRLLFDNSLAGVAIDQFGQDVMLIPHDGEHFTVTVNVAVNVQFYGWLTGLGDKVRILEPQSAVDGMRRHLSALTRLYRSAGGEV